MTSPRPHIRTSESYRMVSQPSQVREAAQQPVAADEVGALPGRLAPPSQLNRVLDGPREKGE